MTTKNLQYLSSRQALADAANFIADLRKWVKYGIQNSTLIVFGGGYAGSLAAWFRSKYSYMVDGAVASSAPMVAEMDFQEYYQQVGAALETTGPKCRVEVDNATKTMYDWWGQPAKREEMNVIFSFTTDQCIDVFQRIFGGSQVQNNVDETNRYYGGRNLPISNVVFVNGGLDPWRPASVLQDLSPDTIVININETSHCADMYPPADTDPPKLIHTRELIGQLIGKWIQRAKQ